MLNNAEAAARIGISPATLKLWRHEGKSPPFIKNNPDSPQSGVSYDPADLDAWIAQRKFDSTSGYSEAARRNVKANISRSAGASA
ncbi:MAG: helix-turn-helix transcriptional regulator [Dehalococcoidia bacterium]